MAGFRCRRGGHGHGHSIGTIENDEPVFGARNPRLSFRSAFIVQVCHDAHFRQVLEGVSLIDVQIGGIELPPRGQPDRIKNFDDGRSENAQAFFAKLAHHPIDVNVGQSANFRNVGLRE